VNRLGVGAKKGIVVFGYDFEHTKTSTGLFWLTSAGFRPELVVLAPWEKLGVPRPSIPTSINNLQSLHPRSVCDALSLPYISLPHNLVSEDTLSNYPEATLGVSLGARILRASVPDLFKDGILNLHPGLLPDNRGLETTTHAVLRGIPQAVTAHMINNEVDKGVKLLEQIVPVYPGESIREMSTRVSSFEMPVLIQSLKLIEDIARSEKEIKSEGIYNSPLNESMQADAAKLLHVYTASYNQIVKSWIDSQGYKSSDSYNPIRCDF